MRAARRFLLDHLAGARSRLRSNARCRRASRRPPAPPRRTTRSRSESGGGPRAARADARSTRGPRSAPQHGAFGPGARPRARASRPSRGSCVRSRVACGPSEPIRHRGSARGRRPAGEPLGRRLAGVGCVGCSTDGVRVSPMGASRRGPRVSNAERVLVKLRSANGPGTRMERTSPEGAFCLDDP